MSIVQQMFNRVFAAQTPTQERVALAGLQIAQRFGQFGRAITEDQIEKWIQYAVIIGVDFSRDGYGASWQTFVNDFSSAAQRGQMLPASGAALASSNTFWDAQVRRVYANVLQREPSAQEAAEAANMLSTGRASIVELTQVLEASKPVFVEQFVPQVFDVDYEEQMRLYEISASPDMRLLDQQASIIEAERDAVLLTGALNADQDMLDQLAKQEFERAAMQAQQAASQEALSMMRAEAAQAYAVEVRADVVDMYRQILKRSPDSFEVDYWTDLVTSGQLQGELIAVRLSQSDEAVILGAYEQFLFRIPDVNERQYWVSALTQGLSVDQAIDYIANSEEAQQYHAAIVPTPGADPLIVQTINPVSGSAQAIDPIMGTSTWGTSYTNQDMIAADPMASPVIELQNYYAPDVNISDLEPVSPIGDISPALAFKARDEIYKAYTTSLKREPSEADYQYWEPLLTSKQLSLTDFKRYVAESEEAKALVKRANDASLTDVLAPEVIADAAKKAEGVGAAIGLLSALTFFLGQ